MKTSMCSEEQIATALRQVDAGAPVPEVTPKLGISDATYDVWRKRYGSSKRRIARSNISWRI